MTKKTRIIILTNLILLAGSLQQIFASDNLLEQITQLYGDTAVIDTNVTVDLPSYTIENEKLVVLKETTEKSVETRLPYNILNPTITAVTETKSNRENSNAILGRTSKTPSRSKTIRKTINRNTGIQTISEATDLILKPSLSIEKVLYGSIS